MNYKKILRSQRLRFAILDMLSGIPDRQMLSFQYYVKTGRKLNWSNPERLTEFIQLYKAQYRNPLMHKCVDKYDVRSYVESIGLGHILNELYGVWQSGKEVDFDSLPDQFAIKTTNGGGGQNLVLCRDKNDLDIPKFRKTLDRWLKLKLSDPGREWAYTGIRTPLIIAEKLITDSSTENGEPLDYKFFCFGGKAYLIAVDINRHTCHSRNIYDPVWNRMEFISEFPHHDKEIIEPENLSELVETAEKLAAPFPFARVDLYDVNGKIIFGELTFYPSSGFAWYNPDSYDKVLGKCFSDAWEHDKKLNPEFHKG